MEVWEELTKRWQIKKKGLKRNLQANFNTTLEKPGPSHVRRNQIKFSSASGEETDEEYTPVSDSKHSNPKKSRPTEKDKISSHLV